MAEQKELAVRSKDSGSDKTDTTGITRTAAPTIRSVPNGKPLTDAQVLQAIINDNAKDDKEKKSKEFLYQHGFRTDFGKNGIKTTEVETNYLEITRRPEKIYVYEIVMIREFEKKEQGDGKEKEVPAHITRRIQREGIFDTIESSTARLSDLKCWATDFDLIWSIAPLFDDKDSTSVPQPYGQVSGHEPITGKSVTAKPVEIKFKRELDLAESVGKLFKPTPAPQNGDQADSSDDDENENAEDDDPSLLKRGINAFVSKFPKASGDLTSTNANTFYRNDTARPLDYNESLKALRGYFVSLRPGSQSLMLNVNVKHSPFMRPGMLSDWMENCKREGRTVRETRGYVKGKMVKILIERGSEHAPNRIGVITAVGRPNQQKPDNWGDYPGDLAQLVINIGSKKTGQGLDGPDYYLASELRLCDNQPFRGILTGDQTTAMLENACKLPKANRELILGEGLSNLGISDDGGGQKAAGFGLEVSQELMKVPARLLAAPTPHYSTGALGQKGTKSVNLAGWNLLNVKVHDNGKLTKLPVLDLRPLRKASAEADLTQLDKVTRKSFLALGICTKDLVLDWRRPTVPAHMQTTKIREPDLKGLMTSTMNKDDRDRPHLVIIPDHDYDLYSKVKRILDRDLGVHSVCASATKLNHFGYIKGKKNPREALKANEDPMKKALEGEQNLSNIGLKFNLKAIGDNQKLAAGDLTEILSKKALKPEGMKPGSVELGPKKTHTIILGADVAHPTASAVPGCPSIAAVVGSVDANFVRFPGSMRLQRSRQEFIADLKDMVKERLLDWAMKHERRLPTSVVFYRDGVSESQYDAVRSKEIPQIAEAFELASAVIRSASTEGASATAAKKPKHKFALTFVIVGKRHNTRFYALNDKDTFPTMIKKKDEDGNGTKDKIKVTSWNITPGMVIDKKITHPYSNDFFLQSHEPLQGTGRSAHYFVLTNQLKFSANDLQKITHSLCYIYARATKGVSYCAPAYYADRLCDRGRAYLRPWLMNLDGFASDRDKDESLTAFQDRIVRQINGDTRYLPNDPNLTRYGEARKNPWHTKMDGVMFYL